MLSVFLLLFLWVFVSPPLDPFFFVVSVCENLRRTQGLHRAALCSLNPPIRACLNRNIYIYIYI